MVFYVKMGKVPKLRHTFDDRNTLYREELFGEESFDGPYSLLYHLREPTRVAKLTKESKEQLVQSDDRFMHRHIHSDQVKTDGDFIKARTVLLFNSTINIGVSRVNRPHDSLYRNALYDELFFVHSGNGRIVSQFGILDFRKGDYVYIPKGTTYYLEPTGSVFLFFIQSRERIGVPRRYLNVYGQLREGTPYYSRDIRIPEFANPSDSRGTFTVKVDYGSYFMVETRDEDPFDLIGYDGYLFPFAINVDNMAPIVGKLHQPPPVHETFSGPSFMVGTFLPRKFDFHPRSIPISYYHSNIDTDEVLFYSSGNFMSRRGISPGSITLHVRGLIHGPQPGAVEASIGKTDTDEVAVMVEAYQPLMITAAAREVEDGAYMKSWYS
ncbi:homogentisate 1,2-dioxygenase [Thermoplasmatales archaeon AK]|nr:homogentisate 1,2-dioxygenase [Thermoplasmatales archaeon AK]